MKPKNIFIFHFMSKLPIIYFLLLTIISCNNYPKDVSAALSKASNNRQELEKVLNLYRGTDDLKYVAACHLIANMLYHGSLNEITLDEKYEVYFRKVDSIYNLLFGNMTLGQIKNLRLRIPDSIRSALSEEYDYIPFRKTMSAETGKATCGLLQKFTGEGLLQTKRMPIS